MALHRVFVNTDHHDIFDDEAEKMDDERHDDDHWLMDYLPHHMRMGDRIVLSI